MSAGRCHGGPCLCPTISAAPGGHRPSVLPWMRICSLALSWCRDWGDAGNHGCSMHGHLGHPDPFSRAYFSRTPSAQGNGGDCRSIGKTSMVGNKGVASPKRLLELTSPPLCCYRASPVGLAIDGSAFRCLRFGAFALGHWQRFEPLPERQGPITSSVAAKPGRFTPLPSPTTSSGCSLLNFLLFCWLPSAAMPPGAALLPHPPGPAGASACIRFALAEAAKPHRPQHPPALADGPCISPAGSPPAQRAALAGSRKGGSARPVSDGRR